MSSFKTTDWQRKGNRVADLGFTERKRGKGVPF